MKHYVVFLVLIGFAGLIIPNTHAELDESILEPFKNNDLVIIGKIIQVNTKVLENKTEYNIQVEEYLKNQKSFDMITAILDGVRSPDFPNYPMNSPNSSTLDYYNKPYFEEGNKVLAYLKQEEGIYKMSPYSFTIEKKGVAGPPTVILPTGPSGYYFSQGDEIVISGVIKKGYMYELGQSEKDSSLNLVILNEKGESIVSKKLTVNVDGTYRFPFQSKGDLRIPGSYSWEIQFGHDGMGGEFVIEKDLKFWTPLKQFKSGISIDEIQCKNNFIVIQKYNGSPACVKPENHAKLIIRGWALMPTYIPGEIPTGIEFPDDVDIGEFEHAACMNTDKKLLYEGKTRTIPYIVRISWNPFDLKTTETVNFEIQMFDLKSKPLQNVTYDFVWKSGPDSGEIDDKYVADFGKIPFDVLPIKTADPCYISVIVSIDKIGNKSFKRTDSVEIEKYGNTSPVAIQFHHYMV